MRSILNFYLDLLSGTLGDGCQQALKSCVHQRREPQSDLRPSTQQQECLGLLTGPGRPPRREGLTPEKIGEAAQLKEAHGVKYSHLKSYFYQTYYNPTPPIAAPSTGRLPPQCFRLKSSLLLPRRPEEPCHVPSGPDNPPSNGALCLRGAHILTPRRTWVSASQKCDLRPARLLCARPGSCRR